MSEPLSDRNGFREGNVVDIRVRLLATGDSEGDCRMSEEFLTGDCVVAARRACGIGGHVFGHDVSNVLLDEINTSREVDYAVFLATDGVYRNNRFVASESHLVIPNTYVMDIARRNARVLFGASVHPYRGIKEMMAETARCISGGAVLFNWLPSIQRIDPEDSRCIPFYIRIAQEGIPLLCHTGHPFAALKSEYANMQCNDPRRLRRALDIGVTVIVSHRGSGFGGESHTSGAYRDDLLEMLRTADKNGWDLYADVSALYASTGKTSFDHVREWISRGDISTSRFLFGSGLPLETHDSCSSEEKNLFDCHYRVLKDAGIPGSVITHAGNILGLRPSHQRIAAVKS
jgi:predicted TIM-barrel fold metal-dependent hydrolase